MFFANPPAARAPRFGDTTPSRRTSAKQKVRQIITGRKIGGAKIEDGRNEHDAVEIQAVTLLQITAQTRRARRAVTFANQKFRREPAPVPRGVQANEIADRFNVFFEIVKFLVFFALHRAAVPRANRVNENQIGRIQKRKFIFDQLIRRRRQIANIGHGNAARTQHAEMQPHRRRAGPAIK